MSHPAQDQLCRMCWTTFDDPLMTAHVRDWLKEEGSMTRRFERICQSVSVEVLREQFVGLDEAGGEAKLLPESPRYWLREIVLSGSDVPWLLGRTLIPECTLHGPEQMLQHIGTVPLGRYLFSHSSLSRDFVEPGRADTLWGRRSLLRLSGKPLLLNELFLPASPLYY